MDWSNSSYFLYVWKLACFNGCVEQKGQGVFNQWQSQFQEVARNVVNPKALCCFYFGKCIPVLLHLDGFKVELCPFLLIHNHLTEGGWEPGHFFLQDPSPLRKRNCS